MNARQWPKDFILDAKKKQYAISNGVDPRKITDFWDDFHDWCLAKGARYKDWDAAFRMRVRKARDWNLFQGRAVVAKKKPKNPNFVLNEAYYQLEKYGRSSFISYARKNGMGEDDIKSVEGKYERDQQGVSIDQIVGRIG